MFGMMKVIDDNALGRYKTHFETEYGKPHPKIRYVTLYPKRSYKRVVDYLTGRWIYGDPIEVNKDETGQVIYEVYEQYLDFDLSKDDRERYDVLNLAHMYDDTFIELPLTKNMKLLQMVCSDLKYNTRLQTLANWINTNIGNLDKFAVYTKYIASREQVAMLLDKLGMTYAIQDGRHKDIKKFKEPTTQVLIADYRSASESINLHDVANIIVFYDSTHDYGVYKQARGRINRIGQTDDITYVHLTARETIEDEVYQALQRKESYDMIGYRGGK
jgi:SNF2 family DNA or RNA helicase